MERLLRQAARGRSIRRWECDRRWNLRLEIIDASPVTRQISGYIRVRAEDLNAARELVFGNPVYEAGGTVEIRELPRTG